MRKIVGSSEANVHDCCMMQRKCLGVSCMAWVEEVVDLNEGVQIPATIETQQVQLPTQVVEQPEAEIVAQPIKFDMPRVRVGKHHKGNKGNKHEPINQPVITSASLASDTSLLTQNQAALPEIAANIIVEYVPNWQPTGRGYCGLVKA